MRKIFYNLTDGELDFDEMILSIRTFLEADPDAEYSIVIGSDSQEKIVDTNGNKSINLITAIVIHRKGYGGKYFWKRKVQNNIHSLREKIYSETLESLNFATAFVPSLKKTLNGNSPNYNLEIHVDVGEHGPTREMIREVVGMVTGNGFVAKTKPDAYGATYVADKHT